MKTCFTNVSHYKRFVHLCSENVLNSLRMEPATETMSVVKDRTVRVLSTTRGNSLGRKNAALNEMHLIF